MNYIVGIAYFCFGLWMFFLGKQGESQKNKVKILRVSLEKQRNDIEIIRIYKNFHNKIGITMIFMGWGCLFIESPLPLIITSLFFFAFCNIKKVKTEEKIKKIQEEKIFEKEFKGK